MNDPLGHVKASYNLGFRIHNTKEARDYIIVSYYILMGGVPWVKMVGSGDYYRIVKHKDELVGIKGAPTVASAMFHRLENIDDHIPNFVPQHQLPVKLGGAINGNGKPPVASWVDYVKEGTAIVHTPRGSYMIKPNGNTYNVSDYKASATQYITHYLEQPVNDPLKDCGFTKDTIYHEENGRLRAYMLTKFKDRCVDVDGAHYMRLHGQCIYYKAKRVEGKIVVNTADLPNDDYIICFLNAIRAEPSIEDTNPCGEITLNRELGFPGMLERPKHAYIYPDMLAVFDTGNELRKILKIIDSHVITIPVEHPGVKNLKRIEIHQIPEALIRLAVKSFAEEPRVHVEQMGSTPNDEILLQKSVQLGSPNTMKQAIERSCKMFDKIYGTNPEPSNEDQEPDMSQAQEDKNWDGPELDTNDRIALSRSTRLLRSSRWRKLHVASVCLAGAVGIISPQVGAVIFCLLTTLLYTRWARYDHQRASYEEKVAADIGMVITTMSHVPE